MAETYRPPQGVKDEAQRALEWIADGKAGSGFTDTGRKRASDLARGAAVSAETVLRIYSYLSRHEVDKNGKGFHPGDDGYPSPGRVAWAAWGGDPALSWTSKIRDQLADRSALLEESMETREMPPSYRPASSDDVPKFTPACASCVYLCAAVDDSGQQSLRCTKWDAPAAADAYCDAWEVNECCLPAWMQDDDDKDDAPMLEMNSAPLTEGFEKRAAENDVPTSDALTTLVNSVFTFYARAHEAHWNVNGADFAEYHALFGEIYEDVFESVDDLAENVRKLGTLAPALEVQSRDVLAGEPEDLARVLLDENEALIEQIRAAFDVATAAGQQGIANFLAERQDAHQKWSWQLRSSLGIAEVRDAELDVEARRSLINSCEKRTIDTELRATRDGGELRVSGYAAMWDREADGLPFKEVIKRGAFARSLDRGDDVFLLVNHDTDQLPLGRRSAGTLVLEEDEVGLHIDAVLDPANPRAAELGSALERGDVDKMSFAFRIAGKDGEFRNDDGVRELRNLDLFEVSVVTWPAYSDTTVGLREAAPVEDLALRARVLRAKLAHQDIK